MIQSRYLWICGFALTLTIGCASKTAPTTKPVAETKSIPTYTFLPDSHPSRSDMELADASRRDITYLADDAREGRGLGTKGINQSASYIAKRFKKLGLHTIEGLDDYYQDFELPFGKEIDKATKLVWGDRELELNKEFVPMGSSGMGSFEGDVVFMGYAINDDEIEYDTRIPQKGYNDFAGIDLKGKVVLAMRYEPHDDDGVSYFTHEKDDYSRNASIQSKMRAARDAGAVALILVTPPEFHEEQPTLQPFEPSAGRAGTFPVIQITQDIANEFLKSSGQSELKIMQAMIDDTVPPHSFELKGVKLKGNVKINQTIVKVKNVVAMLPGEGPHADEYVVVGAHYDHVGKGEIGAMPQNRGQIHNGADDNASGTTAMMQLAEEFSKLPPQPRSLVFIAFTGEESGLLGSEHFVDQSPIPLDKVVAMLNLDMVGRVKDHTLYIGGAGTAEPFEPLMAKLDESSQLNFTDMGKGGRGPSDHASFSKHNVPVIFLFSGTHPDYHKPGDDVEKINFEGMAEVINLGFDIVRNFASMDRAPYDDSFDGERVRIERHDDSPDTTQPAEPRRADRGPRVQLGIMPNYTDADTEPGVVIGGVLPHTAAEAAGLKEGDRIIQLNESKIDTLESLFEWLGRQKIGDTVKITFIRNGETKIAESKLKARGEEN